MCIFIHCRKVFGETKLQKTKKPDLCAGFFKKFLSDNSEQKTISQTNIGKPEKVGRIACNINSIKLTESPDFCEIAKAL